MGYQYRAVAIGEEGLSHHGILGMKWGRRNGPPYPLGASDHSASEKKAGWRKSLSSDDRAKIKAKKKAEKAKIYKKKEYAKAEERYDRRIQKYSKAVDKYKASGKEKHLNKAAQLELTKKGMERMKSKELKAIMKMSPDDVSKEKKAVAKALVGDVLLSGAVVGMGTAMGLPVVPVFYTDVAALKTNRRIGKKKKG